MVEVTTTSLSMPEPDIAVLALDLPGKGDNVLSRGVLAELDSWLGTLEHRDDLAGLIITSRKPGMFVAGADLQDFVAPPDRVAQHVSEMGWLGQTLFLRLAKCPFVTVAAIDGVCLGGGAELAVWCDRRIMTDSPTAEFGFPDVTMGSIPCWGGTARAPRIVGMAHAVKLITRGKSIDARTALAMGWADDLVASDRLIQTAIDRIRAEQASGQYRKDRQRWQEPVDISDGELESLRAKLPARLEGATAADQSASRVALDVMTGAARVSLDEACRMEAEAVSRLSRSPVRAALVNVFFLTDRNQRDAGVDHGKAARREISSVGVVGAGIMGSGIAVANLKHRLPVKMMDASQEALDDAMSAILDEVAASMSTQRAEADSGLDFATLLSGSVSGSELVTCDAVIESVVENADVKRRVYARIEPQMKPDAILASNTSTIPISDLAKALQRADRFCGMHFCNPVREMKLVEVVRGRETSDQTVATAVAYCKRLGKSPIVVNDSPGFIVNRLLFPYLNESMELVREGAPLLDIDQASVNFGMPLGPLALYDLVGIDTSYYAGRIMWDAFRERVNPSPIIMRLVKVGRLGQKTGLGFYSYQNEQNRPELDPDLDPHIQAYINDVRKEFTEVEITNRLLLPMVLEATRVIEEDIVRDVRDIDLAMVFGLGFPRSKGGLLFWADTLGARTILEMLRPLEPLGERFRPTPLLVDMARHGRKFYDG